MWKRELCVCVCVCVNREYECVRQTGRSRVRKAQKSEGVGNRSGKAQGQECGCVCV
ncbi:MAG: hypothetical protein P4L40_15120 [Terracidiphilus sp.]|nr:hypothetical protein [Terracidiphilus sp.]